MRRREFIAGFGSAAAWPLAARAQQAERVRRIGVLMTLTADDPESAARITAFAQGLAELGWTVGRNVQIEYRFVAGDAGLLRQYTAELIGLAPDLILTQGSFAVGPLLLATRTIPIVFTNSNDPVGTGLVASLARPGSNATGFMGIEFSAAGKSLELLKQIAPGVRRAAVLRDPTQGGGTSMFAAIQTVAPSLRVEVTPVNVRDAGQIERDVTAFALGANDGLVVTTSTLAQIHRDVIIGLAAQHRMPAVYPYRYFVTRGGLISYGLDQTIQYRHAAGYVDRILKGEKPADLPVQAPTKYEMVINLKTAKALGLTIPETLLATADEVIQ
jgi:putative tryptophan/tyrosine transport system substrate-binding protein